MGNSTTDQKILEAAQQVFQTKGFAGARMQEIADAAGINKGLLHYYFKSKQALFDAIFEEALRKFLPGLRSIFESDDAIPDKIDHFIHSYINFLIGHPYLPGFIIQEINRNPELLIRKIRDHQALPNPSKLFIQIQLETQSGQIRPIDPIHLAVNLISMCVFPFAARPMLQYLLQIDQPTYLAFMETRKQAISQFARQALLPCP